jgi:hypothetical protein
MLQTIADQIERREIHRHDKKRVVREQPIREARVHGDRHFLMAKEMQAKQIEAKRIKEKEEAMKARRKKQLDQAVHMGKRNTAKIQAMALFGKYQKHINKATAGKMVKCSTQLKTDFPTKDSNVSQKELNELYSTLNSTDKDIAIQDEEDLKEVAFIRFVKGRQFKKDAQESNIVYRCGHFRYEYNQFETLQANQDVSKAQLVRTEWVETMFKLQLTELVRMANGHWIPVPAVRKDRTYVIVIGN